MSLNAQPGSRRRASILSRARPRTAGVDSAFSQQPARPHTGIWVPHQDGSYREAVSHFTHEAVAYEQASDLKNQCAVHDVEETVPLTPPANKHRPSKSFSSLRQGVSGLRRRLSLSLRSKPSKNNPDLPWQEKDNKHMVEQHREHDHRAGWFRSHRLPRRQASLNALSYFHSASPVTAPIPGNGSEPPILPNDLSRGAAARAAAATQNEMVKLGRVGSKEDSKLFESTAARDARLSRDTESGIEINLGSSLEDIDNDELDVVRKDPVYHLPAEIMAHVLSFLDAESLKRAEHVSRSWRIHASSRHVWRDVFRHEYGHTAQVAKTINGRSKSMGLGKTLPNQDWKKMFAVRRTLENRWRQGKAAAIYLRGHTDSVYCVQFDEHKIITGSRDRTIRIWDAHYPWQCQKIIGPPPTNQGSVASGPLAMNPTTESTGRSPFISICPPSQPRSDLAKFATQQGDYHDASILCLQFDDEIMVTGSSDHTCIVWDVKDDYKVIRRFGGHTAGVLDVCFNEKYIVSCSKDTTICVWDRNSGELVKKLLGHRGPVNAVQLRGDLVVSASGDGVAKLWNVTSGLCIKEFPSGNRGLACVEFSEDSRTILAGGNDQVIYQFDANTGELVKELQGHSGLVRSLHLDSTTGRIVSGSYDMSVKVFDSKRGELSIDLPGWTTSWMLSAKSDYRRIVATSQDSRAVIMDFGYGLDGIDLLE